MSPNGPPVLKRKPAAIGKVNSTTSLFAFQAYYKKIAGLCSQARQTEPRNMGGLERAGRRRLFWRRS